MYVTGALTASNRAEEHLVLELHLPLFVDLAHGVAAALQLLTALVQRHTCRGGVAL